MTPDMKAKLKQLLIIHEGYSKTLYYDTSIPPKATIGIGYNISARGMDDSWILQQFSSDADATFKDLENEYPWFSELSNARQIALCDMAWFGIKKFSTFIHLIDALSKHDYLTASNEILNSEYEKEVGQRAKDIANIILTNKL